MPVGEVAPIAAKAAVATSVSAASAPPATTASASPRWIIRGGGADRVGAGRAGRDDAVGVAVQAVAHRHRAGGGVAHHQRHRQRRDRLGAALAQHVLLLLERARGRRSRCRSRSRSRSASYGQLVRPARPASSASSAAASASWVKRSARRASLRREEVGRRRTRAQRPTPSSIPHSPAAQRSISVRRADAQRGDGADAR